MRLYDLFASRTLPSEALPRPARFLWRAGVLALVGAALLQPAAAHAGYYEVTRTSAAGTATYTPRVGSVQTITLTEPAYTRMLINGTLSYTFTETYEYIWMADSAEDPPVEDYFLIDGEGSMYFNDTNDAFTMSGTGTASISIGYYSEGASGSAGPDGQGGVTFTHSGTGTHQLDPGYEMNGSIGSFTVEYSGAMTTSSDAITGHWTMANPATGNKLIKITNATHTAPNMFTNETTITVQGYWSSVRGGDQNVANYRIALYFLRAPTSQQSAMLGGPHGIVYLNGTGVWGPSSFTRQNPSGSGGLKVVAVLQHFNPDGWGPYPDIPAAALQDVKISTQQ